MVIAVVLLALLCAILGVRLYALDRDLKHGAEQLRERKSEGSAAPLRLAAPSASAEALLAEVNRLLRDGESERAAFREREQALRRQIANVSHDLRTPLTSILGYLQLLEREDLSEGEKQTYLDIIESRARVLQGLITSFYDLSRLEAGEYPIARQPVELREAITALLAAFYDELEAQFQVTVELPEDMPPVWGDRAALERVYTNLIRNALEHGGGRLHISARWSGEWLETAFSNEGADLREEDLPRVFDRFFTSDQTRSGRNTGLGLAIVKTLTEQMGGVAQATLAGGTFTVLLTWKVSG